MRIARVIGNVTLNQAHPSLEASALKLAYPLDVASLQGGDADPQETLVVYDELGAGNGDLIAVSEGREAAQPFAPNFKPVDAYNAAILDHVEIRPEP